MRFQRGDVLGQQVAGGDQGGGAVPHPLQVFVPGGVAFLNRRARVAGSQPGGAGGGEGDGAAGQGTAGGQGLAGAADVGMAHVPAGVGGQGDGNGRQAHAAGFVAVIVQGGDQRRVGGAYVRGYPGGNGAVGAEVQTADGFQMVGEGGVRQGSEQGGGVCGGDDAAVGVAGIPIVGRRFIMGNPAVEAMQGGAHQRAVVNIVEEVYAARAGVGVDVGQGQRGRGVLGAGEKPGTHIVGQRNIGLAVRGGMGQGAVSAPVFGGGVGVDDFGGDAAPGCFGQDAVGAVAVEVAEGQQVVDAVVGQAGGLSEADVEFAHFAAGDVGQHSVKDDAAGGFVPVQAQVEELAEEASALAASVGVGAAQGAGERVDGAGGVGRFVAQPGGDVPRGQQAEANYRGVTGFVADAIDLARRKAAVQSDAGGIGEAAAVGGHTGECPLRAGDDGFGAVLVVLNGKDGIPAFQVVGRIGLVVAVGEELRVGGQGGLEGYDDRAGDRGAVGVNGVGDSAAEQAGGVGDVVLPAAPDQGVAGAHQVAVAGMREGFGGRIGGAVEVFEGQFPAPVGDVQQQPAVAVVVVHGLEDAEIGGEFHQAGEVAGGEGDVGDNGVVGMFRVNGEMGEAVNALVGAHRAEGLAVGEGEADSGVQSG